MSYVNKISRSSKESGRASPSVNLKVHATRGRDSALGTGRHATLHSVCSFWHEADALERIGVPKAYDCLRSPYQVVKRNFLLDKFSVA